MNNAELARYISYTIGETVEIFMDPHTNRFNIYSSNVGDIVASIAYLDFTRVKAYSIPQLVHELGISKQSILERRANAAIEKILS